MELESRFVVEIKTLPRAKKWKGYTLEVVPAGKKMLRKMKKEAVDCPVSKETVPFIECLGCQSFIRRVKGRVHCRG